MRIEFENNNYGKKPLPRIITEKQAKEMNISKSNEDYYIISKNEECILSYEVKVSMFPEVEDILEYEYPNFNTNDPRKTNKLIEKIPDCVKKYCKDNNMTIKEYNELIRKESMFKKNIIEVKSI